MLNQHIHKFSINYPQFTPMHDPLRVWTHLLLFQINGGRKQNR